MKQYKNTLQQLSATIYESHDTLPGLPIVELAGDKRVLIENHRGITEYGAEQICVKVKYGLLCISGYNMELAKMAKDQLVITGQIESITIRRKGLL